MSISQFSINPSITSVKYVASDSVPGAYFNGSLNNGVGATFSPAISNPGLINGDRVLLVAQENANENGIYIVTSDGVNFVITRSADFQCIEQISIGQIIAVGNPDPGIPYLYVVSQPIPGILGVDPLFFGRSIQGRVTDSWDGGSTSNTFGASGLNNNSIVTASIKSSQNSVGINKVTPGLNTLTIEFSADPGTGTVINWISDWNPLSGFTMF